MKKESVVFFAFFFCNFLFAQGLITNIEGRKTVNLDGKWQVLIDPYENGFYDYRYKENPNGFFKNSKPQNSYDHIEYDFDKSFSLNVPGDWNTQKPELFFYEGTVWYKKSFNFSASKNTRQFLQFEAVNYKAVVYLNGSKIGEHEGGFTPFNFEITGKLKEKDNFVVVKVDNKRSKEYVPTLNTDWWNYGGITRSVNIIEVPSIFVENYKIQLNKGKMNEIGGWIKINGSNNIASLKIVIPEAKIEKEISLDNAELTKFSLKAKVELWSPEVPKLYDVFVILNNDTVADKIGFRTIEAKDGDILLNGKKIFLRGISIHEEAPMRTGRAFCYDDSKTLLGWAKELGCNYVRLAHYPHNETMLRTADKLGLLVWSEIPVYWTIEWQNKATLANALKQLEDMIARDINRCAVIFWSVANETPLSDERLQFLKTLLKWAKELDPERLLTAAMERHYIDEITQMIDDPLGEFVDALGCNEYIGWYDGLPEKADNVVWKTIYKKPLIMSELGGEALYGFHADDKTAWSEESQDNIYKHQIDMLKKIPFLSGMTPWILMDFRSPRRQLTGMQDYFNRKGLISERGEKKKAFYTLQKFYNEKMNEPAK